MSKDLFMQERENEQLPPATTESDIIDYITNLSFQVADGKRNPLRSYITLKRISELCAGVIKDIQESAIDEAMKYGEKKFQEAGAMVELKSAAGKWDYAHIQSIAATEQRLKALNEIAKQAYKLGTEIPDPQTGEMIPPAQFTEGKQTIAISFKI
jgi:hypothetical protein